MRPRTIANLPLISIVIPTYRRFECLLNTVNDVLRQEYVPFEVIVADQNARWPEELYSERARVEADPRVRWMSFDTPGVVQARNRAAQRSYGKLLLFLDDDVRIPNRRFLNRHVANYADETISCVTGRELRVEQLGTSAVPDDALLPGRPVKEEAAPWSLDPAVIQALFFDRNSDRRYEVATFCTCNGSIRRSEFLKVGGFDENFSGNSYGDDFDLAIRLAQTGSRLIYDPQAALIHLRAPAGGLRLKDERNTFSEMDKALSGWLFLMRHARKGCRWHLAYDHVLRKTVFLKRNVICFWRQPRVWWGLIAAWREARRLVRNGPISSLLECGKSDSKT